MEYNAPFFALLRAGLWKDNLPDASLFPVGSTDWAGIYQMAKEQTLVGILFDGLLKLPVAHHPALKLKMEWYAMVMQIEQQNERMNHVLFEVLSIYERAGLHPILLKGQGVAQNYLYPMHRQCGDIDLYVGEEGIEMANRLLREAGGKEKEDSDKHRIFCYRGIYIENHWEMATIFRPGRCRKFKETVKTWYPFGAPRIEIDGHQVSIPPAGFNSTFLFAHLYGHFFGGIGLRQLCDWTMQLNNHPSPDVEILGWDRMWRICGCIAVDYLGLPATRMPFYSPRYRKGAERALEIIFSDGNFGYSRQQRFAGRSRWRRWASGSGMLIKRFYTFARLAPKDLWEYIFFHQFKKLYHPLFGHK